MLFIFRRASLCPNPQRPLADPVNVRQAAHLIRSSVRPLVIVGKGNSHCSPSSCSPSYRGEGRDQEGGRVGMGKEVGEG